MPSKPPVRQTPADMAGTTASDELKAQLRTRAKAKRPKQTYDLPQSLIDAVRAIADRESVAQSDIAALALIDFVERYEAGKVDLHTRKAPARSLRVDWKIELPKDWE